MSYVLEAQEFVQEPLNEKGFYHRGYMNKIFKTKQEACDFYDIHNPNMRSLNAHNTWCSDWDPNTYLRYVVRKFNCEHMSIDSWDGTKVRKLINGVLEQ